MNVEVENVSKTKRSRYFMDWYLSELNNVP